MANAHGHEFWERLVREVRAGARQVDVAFRRQVVLGRYVADFAAPRAKLVVEVDGELHAGRAAADARRDRDLGRMGYRVLRLPRALVQERLEEVVALVVAALGNRR